MAANTYNKNNGNIDTTLKPLPATGEIKTEDGDIVLSEQVSFIVQHKVIPGHEADYEAWLHRITLEAAKFRGHMGTQIARPSAGSDVYEISVRFANRADADNWIHSQTRKNLVDEVSRDIAEPEKLKVKSGIDYWFTAVTEGHKSPKVWKQWLTTVSVIWPLSMVLPLVLEHLFAAVPVLGTFGVRHLVSAMCMVGLLVWVIMPRYSRLLSK